MGRQEMIARAEALIAEASRLAYRDAGGQAGRPTGRGFCVGKYTGGSAGASDGELRGLLEGAAMYLETAKRRKRINKACAGSALWRAVDARGILEARS